jgi:hypothetical protein
VRVGSGADVSEAHDTPMITKTYIRMNIHTSTRKMEGAYNGTWAESALTVNYCESLKSVIRFGLFEGGGVPKRIFGLKIKFEWHSVYSHTEDGRHVLAHMGHRQSFNICLNFYIIGKYSWRWHVCMCRHMGMTEHLYTWSYRFYTSRCNKMQ